VNDISRRYIRVLIVWAAILASLYGFQEYFT
jgi:hypothetical protein